MRAPRAAGAALALAAALAGLGLALHHPLSPTLAVLGLLAWSLLVFWRPDVWLVGLPAVLPLAKLSPWTGWIGVDEFDILVLGTLAGGYARCLIDARATSSTRLSNQAGLSLPLLGGVLLAVSSLLGLCRGLADAGMHFGWFQGYGEPLNVLRAFKAPMLALALWPLLHRALRERPQQALRWLFDGLLGGLAIVVLAVAYERAAYPGLWDFSAPYRTTALFWEMHVGGAAIDAYLVLAMPFVAWALWSARRPLPWLAAALLALGGVYAGLTTFARGVYLALALPMLGLGLWLLARRIGPGARRTLTRAVGFIAVACAGAALYFITLAWLGTPGVLGTALALLLLLAALRRRLPGWRDAAALALALLLVLEVVAVFGTGNFMLSRLVASDKDFNNRLAHWGDGLSLLHDPSDWAFGIGLGRLPNHYARFVPGGEFSGTAAAVTSAQGEAALRLAGPKTDARLAGLYLLSQRVPLQPGVRYRAAFDVRVHAPTTVGVSVCEVHLLYERRCQEGLLRLQPRAAAWQHVVLSLRGPALHAGAWAAPRRAAFSIAVLNAGGEVEVTRMQLLGSGDVNLLQNGSFEAGMTHWLPVAQYYFLPWHIDNLYLEWLIERGLLGALPLAAALGLALWNLVLGPGRRHPVAPFLAASIGGVLVLGLLSSVMDTPRVAWLFFVLVGASLMLDSDAADAISGADRPATWRWRRWRAAR